MEARAKGSSGGALPAPRRVAVFRARGLGDMLCAVPALRALRHRWPKAHVVLIGLSWAEALARRLSAYVDEFVAFPGYPGIAGAEVPQALHEFVVAMHRREFDLAIQMHGDGSVSNRFVVGLGAPRTAGFYAPGPPRPGPRFLPYPRDLHEIRRCLRLVESLGAKPLGDHLEFPVTDEDEEECRALRLVSGFTSGPYVCIHPAGSRPDGHWPAERFAAIGRGLARTGGHRVVVTGTAAEAYAVSAVARQVPDALALAGRTTLGSMAVLLRDARMLLCSDTGVSHLAAALRTPSVTLCVGVDPRRAAPLDHLHHRAVGDGTGADIPLDAVRAEVDALLPVAARADLARR